MADGMSTKLNINSNLAALVGDITSATKALKKEQKDITRESRAAEKRGGLSARGDLAARQAMVDKRKGQLALTKRTNKLIGKKVKLSTKQQVQNSVGGIRETISGLARGDVGALRTPGRSLKRMRGRLMAGGNTRTARLVGGLGSTLASGAVLGLAGAGVLALRQLHSMKHQDLIDSAGASRMQGDILSGIRTMGLSSGASAADMQTMMRRVNTASTKASATAANADILSGVKGLFGMTGAYKSRGQQSAKATQSLLQMNRKLGARLNVDGSMKAARQKFLTTHFSKDFARQGWGNLMNFVSGGARYDEEIRKEAEKIALLKAQGLESRRQADLVHHKSSPFEVNNRINAITTSHQLRAVERQEVIKTTQWNSI